MPSSCLRSGFLGVFLLAEFLNGTDRPEHDFCLDLRDFRALDDCTCCVANVVVIAQGARWRVPIVVGTRCEASVRVANIIVVQIALAIAMTIFWHLSSQIYFRELDTDDAHTGTLTGSASINKWNETPSSETGWSNFCCCFPLGLFLLTYFLRKVLHKRTSRGFLPQNFFAFRSQTNFSATRFWKLNFIS